MPVHCCAFFEQMVAVQIMMLLTQQHARPDILSVGSLPGETWPGMQEYKMLMQVCISDCRLFSLEFLCRGLVQHCVT